MKAIVWTYEDGRTTTEDVTDVHVARGDLILTQEDLSGQDEYAVFQEGTWASLTVFPGYETLKEEL